MRRVAPLLLVVGLIAAGCGDDSAGSSTTTPGSTTTAAATTTTAAATTTTAAPTTTAGFDPVAAAAAMAGTYSGAWHNTTFGSTGSVDVEITVDTDAKSLIATTTLGGNVFGVGAPDPILTEIDLTQTGLIEGSSALLGDYTIQVDPDGSFTLLALAVPTLGMALAVEGTLDPMGMEFTYTITQGNGTVFAEGTMNADPTG